MSTCTTTAESVSRRPIFCKEDVDSKVRIIELWQGLVTYINVSQCLAEGKELVTKRKEDIIPRAEWERELGRTGGAR